MNQIHYVPLLIHHYDLHASLAGLSSCTLVQHLPKGARELCFWNVESLQVEIIYFDFLPLALGWHWHDTQIMLQE